MTRVRLAACIITLGLAQPVAARAQDATALRAELLGQFNASISKVIALAEAMPADKYQWKPQADAMPVAHVFAHIANYNFAYPSGNMGVAAPAGIRLDTLEAMRDKAQIVALLKRSADYVRQSVSGMPAAELNGETQLYGRQVPRWAVMLQLVAHMNEHLGQSIAYARANEIVPPWSR